MLQALIAAFRVAVPAGTEGHINKRALCGYPQTATKNTVLSICVYSVAYVRVCVCVCVFKCVYVSVFKCVYVYARAHPTSRFLHIDYGWLWKWKTPKWTSDTWTTLKWHVHSCACQWTGETCESRFFLHSQTHCLDPGLSNIGKYKAAIQPADLRLPMACHLGWKSIVAVLDTTFLVAEKLAIRLMKSYQLMLNLIKNESDLVDLIWFS